MKVLHVVNISFVLPYYIGKQFNYFSKKGIKFYVACTPSQHLIDYSLEKKFIPIPINILRKISPVQDIKSVILLVKFIRKEKIDIIVGHTPKGGMIAMLAAYFTGVNTRVYFRHGLMFETSKGFKRLLLELIEKLTGYLATKVICVSKSVLDQSVISHLNNSKKNILLHKGTCNGIDTKKFMLESVQNKEIRVLKNKYGITLEDKVIGYVGRMVNDKGITQLLEAWRILTKKYLSIKLLLVGPLENRDSISLVNKQYIYSDKSIIFTDLVSDVVPFYAIMNIFVLPSFREGFPTVVLEASSMELPIITSRSTGCIDSILENETGIFSEINGFDIAEKISFYLENDEIAKEHGKKGRNFVEINFKEDLIWKEIEEKIFAK